MPRPKDVVTNASNSPAPDFSKADEVEPNDELKSATHLQIPVRAAGVILRNPSATSDSPDQDWFAFSCKQHERWVIETIAKTTGSPVDTRIEVLDQSGKPILRTRLQATRESYFTFRGKDSTIADDFRLHRWEDMELNEYLYCGGEVVKLWLYPRGPDSGFRVYPGFGSRFTYFDTTATTHALGEPVWIVHELPKDATPLPNGLPVFPIYYENDDDSTRKTDKDSRIVFEAPEDGQYFIRVRDARVCKEKITATN